MGVEWIVTNNVFFPNKLICVEKSSPFYHMHSVLCSASSFLLGALNKGANTSNLTSANVSKSHCVIHLNTLLL